MRQTRITLADLDKSLSDLGDGALHNLSTDDYKRLFGENDAALSRLRHFVKGHGCVASFSDDSIVFRKLVSTPPQSCIQNIE
ncbi:hypothetical protein XH98_30970 [Bradyrhizobium sp. CCBAU 51745]|jgi:hypothetical protein|nr:hypothetical protein [Bradyrhizobium sp. CCBAU 45384]MDA9443431.1 hypothetical protein [Bradyrhizobium sp. CCBAU 51745]